MLKEYLNEINIEPTVGILEKFQIFSDMLVEWNKKVNLTAITDKNEIEIKHFIDSLTIFKTGKIKDGLRLIDVGCGAGFPSFPIKFANDSIHVTLLDSLNKRVVFQNEVIKNLKLSNVETVHSRAEDEIGRASCRERV